MPTQQNKVPRIQRTHNYKRFETRTTGNRNLNEKSHSHLKESMETHGFLPCYPIVCIKGSGTKLKVLDGQHRLAMAETLNLPVFYVIIQKAFDVAAINCTPKTWTILDYVNRWIDDGIEDYQAVKDFVKEEKKYITLSQGFSLLQGYEGYAKAAIDLVKSGNYAITDEDFAENVLEIYRPLVDAIPGLDSREFLRACARMVNLSRRRYIDMERLLSGCLKLQDRFMRHTTYKPYLMLFEDAYNYKRRQPESLAFDAEHLYDDEEEEEQETDDEEEESIFVEESEMVELGTI